MAFAIDDNLSFSGTTSGTSVHLNNVPANDTIIVSVAVNTATANRATVTDSASNTYTRFGQYSGTGQEIELFYTSGIISQGNAHTITVTCQTGDVWTANVAVVAGIAFEGADVKAGSSGTGTALSGGATATLSKPNSIVFGVCAHTSNRTFTNGSGFTTINSVSNGTSISCSLEYKTVSSTAAQTASGSIDISNNWVCGGFVFADVPSASMSNLIEGVTLDQATFAAGSTLTTSNITSSGSNTLLVVVVSIWQDVAGTGSVSGITFNGTSLTSAITRTSGSMRSEIWYLKNPSTTPAGVAVTVTGNTDSRKIAAYIFTGIDQTTPLDTTTSAVGTSSPITASITAGAANNILVDCVSEFNTIAVTKSASQNVLEVIRSNSAGGMSGTKLSASGSNTMSYTKTGVDDWSFSVASFKAVTAGGATSSKLLLLGVG